MKFTRKRSRLCIHPHLQLDHILISLLGAQIFGGLCHRLRSFGPIGRKEGGEGGYCLRVAMVAKLGSNEGGGGVRMSGLRSTGSLSGPGGDESY